MTKESRHWWLSQLRRAIVSGPAVERHRARYRLLTEVEMWFCRLKYAAVGITCPDIVAARAALDRALRFRGESADLTAVRVFLQKLETRTQHDDPLADELRSLLSWKEAEDAEMTQEERARRQVAEANIRQL